MPLLPVGSVHRHRRAVRVQDRDTSDVRLNVDQIQRVDLQLDAGNVSETVEVRSAAVALDTASASIGHNITEKQVTELPLNGRNFLQLLFLGAGAVETGGEQGAMRRASATPSASWARADVEQLHARRDGEHRHGPRHAGRDPLGGRDPGVQGQTTTYSAEYGFSANQINIVSKTGTNNLHGTAFGFVRNDALDARNFFDLADAEKPKLDQNQFGFVVGGPVCCRSTTGATRRSSWSTTKARAIERGFKRSTPCRLRTNWRAGSRRPSSIRSTGQPFPNNTIPQSRFSRLAQLALRTTGTRRRTPTRPRATIAGADAAEGPNQFTLRGDQDLGKLGRSSGATRRRTYDNRTDSNRSRWRSSSFRTRRTGRSPTHWPIRRNIVNQFRIGHVDARADQNGIHCPRPTSTSSS